MGTATRIRQIGEATGAEFARGLRGSVHRPWRSGAVIRVDASGRRAIAQGGCVWRDLDIETQQFGLAVTGGLVSSTGIAGFTLGGGIGWLSRRCGVAADSLVAAEVACAGARDELTTLAKLTTAPVLPFVPVSLQGTPVVLVSGCWSGSAEDGARACERFRSLGTVLTDTYTSRDYVQSAGALDPCSRGACTTTSQVASLPASTTPRSAGLSRRLVAVKDHYDPGNLFRLNQNIQPSSPEGESS